MTTRLINLLWINLDYSYAETSATCLPMPQEYLDALLQTGHDNGDAAIVFWIDAKRLSAQQQGFLKSVITQSEAGNITLRDLNELDGYRDEPLYQQAETQKNWRTDKHSLIWRQVDAAKVLVTLEGHADQTFFFDFDSARAVDTPRIQRLLGTHGLFVSCMEEFSEVENQFWGITPARRVFFEQVYERTLQEAYERFNGFNVMHRMIRSLAESEGLEPRDVGLPAIYSRPRSYHPGHAWQTGTHQDNAFFNSCGRAFGAAAAGLKQILVTKTVKPQI